MMLGVAIRPSSLLARGDGVLMLGRDCVGVMRDGRFLPPGVRFDGIMMHPDDVAARAAAAQQDGGDRG